MQIIVNKCEICGREERSDNDPHWTNRIQAITLTMEKHISIQDRIFVGDCCAGCGRKLAKVIHATINELRTAAETEEDSND